ncbi:uncharacterized protein LOC131052086 [Cryptomeria japonica]|uniref:uncharacterized protein LOC131052086 n=1 Tax=Cryptomeria japonica TaxID=3369 RepID=UPI0025ACD863|nr:uncharacterized protein LOC131052086 [Cryptomeria japonica]
MSEMREEEQGPQVSQTRKLRVLCLHGFRTSGSFLQKQVSKWDSSIMDKLDMTFLDGLFPAGGKSEIEGIFPPPYYEWFQYNEEFTEYTNLDKGFAFIADYMEKNGPFDGLLGFSQGATLSGALVGYQRKGVLLKNHPPIKFIISVSGTKFRKPEMCEILYTPTIECPSVHMIGAKDWLKEPSEEFTQAFKDPLVIKHPQGHTVPRLDTEAVKQLNEFIDSLVLKEAEEKPENGHMLQSSTDESTEISKPICNGSSMDMVDGIIPVSTESLSA